MHAMAQAATEAVTGAARTAPATIGDSEFDRDTAVTLREEGVYDAELSAGWTIIHAVNGGYLLALLGRALGEALPHPDPFSVSAHYL
ncbi:thioesterase family protein, partial [Streptomyces sp. SID7982]|nr:thioesterase family protein [Streptomyces sp. SID7982]